MQWSKRPVIVLGHGVRAAGADAARVMRLGVPVLTSWQAADLVDNDHWNYFGRPGVYGQRCANKVLHNADMVLAIGCRLSVPMVGHDGIRPDQRLVMVDLDEAEARKFPHAEWINEDAKVFIDGLDSASCDHGWFARCNAWRREHPWVEQGTHDNAADVRVNSYRFMERLQPYLRPDEIIVTDMGTALICAHQVMRLKPPQRLMTSGGLGEMGCALPAAIGASFATGKGRVICLHCDGGMMLNLQELQTIAHHQLPVKIIVFVNDGYSMIRKTQSNLGMKYSGVNKDSGVSCPNFVSVARSFGIESSVLFDYESLRLFMDSPGPQLLAVHLDPDQRYAPKLEPIVEADGTVRSPQFEEMSPRCG